MESAGFTEHPEGGRFREVYRSATSIRLAERGDRSALTHIYFSLRAGEASRFHRLHGDEVWSLYQGTGIHLYQWDGRSPRVERLELSERTGQFCHAIPAGCWQAALPMAGAVLVGCTVAPGFEFADFELLKRESPLAQTLLRAHPDLDGLVSG